MTIRPRLAAVASLIRLMGAAWADEVTGRVFVDANADGVGRAADEPLTGVLVSDGIVHDPKLPRE